MLVLFLTCLCLLCLATFGVVLLVDQADEKGVKRQAEKRRATRGEPARPTTPADERPVSERRIADESRRLIEEIEQFLAEHRSG